MHRAFTDIPEGQIHYRFEGQGEPLLLLHAAVTSSNEFSRVMPFLSKSCHWSLPWISWAMEIQIQLLTNIRY